MKKYLLLMFTLIMALSLVACGDDTNVDAPASQGQEDASDELANTDEDASDDQANADGDTSDDQANVDENLSDEQAKADEDYAMLMDFMDRISINYQEQQDISSLVEQVRSGEIEESAILELNQHLAESSSVLLEDVKNTVWATNYYDDKVALLTECVESLALYQQVNYEAGANNDESKLETLEDLINDYNIKLDALLDAMGV